MALLSQGRTAAAQCGLFTHTSVPVIFEPPFNYALKSFTVQKVYSDKGKQRMFDSKGKDCVDVGELGKKCAT